MIAVAIDLGTHTTRVGASRGIVEAPSVVATPTASRPALRGSVVVDVQAAAMVLRPLLGRMRRFGIAPRRALTCVPRATRRSRSGRH